MAVAPPGAPPRPAFARLRQISERLRSGHPGARVISAGMSGDLEDAIWMARHTCGGIGAARLAPADTVESRGMGALRKTMQYLGLVDTGEEDEDYLDDDEPSRAVTRAPI